MKWHWVSENFFPLRKVLMLKVFTFDSPRHKWRNRTSLHGQDKTGFLYESIYKYNFFLRILWGFIKDHELKKRKAELKNS